MGRQGWKCVPEAMSTAAGRTGGRTLRLSGKSGQSSLLAVRKNARVGSEPITGNSKTSALTKKPARSLHRPDPSRHVQQHTALHLDSWSKLRKAPRDASAEITTRTWNLPFLSGTVLGWRASGHSISYLLRRLVSHLLIGIIRSSEPNASCGRRSCVFTEGRPFKCPAIG